MTHKMIRFINVTKHYPQSKQPALTQLSFSIATGGISCITGASGAGKSTLLKLIMLLEQPTSGQIFINNVNIATLSNRKTVHIRRQIGMVCQTPQLLAQHTVFDNIALPLFINGYRQPDIKRRVLTALNKVHLLNKAHHYPTALSIGEQKRVEIARAIINKPTLLLMDEPIAHLDPESSDTMIALLKLCHQAGITLLIATHHARLPHMLSAQTITLQQGKLKEASHHAEQTEK